MAPLMTSDKTDQEQRLHYKKFREYLKLITCIKEHFRTL